MASIDEILEKADFREDGKYYFNSLTDEERRHLRYAGISDDEIVVDKNYKVGQEKERNFSVVNEGAADDDKKAGLSADLQKSYDFWNKFNETSERTGVSYNIENVENKCLLVEAKKGEKTVFKGIDHGSRGFDVIKKDNSYEQPLEFFDLLVKKAKTSNPKTVIRIKDNVTDPVLRNKILIACAKNNATPVGNLPKGFDFEELKALVRRAKSPEELDELVNALYMQNGNEYAFGTSNSDEKGHANRNTAKPVEQEKKENNNHAAVAPVILPQQTNNAGNSSLEQRIAEQQAQLAKLQKQLADQHAAQQAAARKQAEENKAAINAAAQSASQQTVSKREGWWKRNLKKGLLYTALITASLFGVQKCSDKDRDDKIDNQTELLTDHIDRLAAENCAGWTNLISERDSLLQRTQELEKDLDDCARSKVKKPAPVKKKPVVKKPTPVVVRDTVTVTNTIHGDPVIIPGKTIQLPDTVIPGKVIQQPDTVIQGKKKIVLDGSMHHEIDKEISGEVLEGTVVTGQNGKRTLNSSQQHEINNETYTGFMETLASLESENEARSTKQKVDTTQVVRRRILNSNIH